MAYSVMKTETIREIMEVIAHTTSEIMIEIKSLVATAQALAVREMHSKYEAILNN